MRNKLRALTVVTAILGASLPTMIQAQADRKFKAPCSAELIRATGLL